MLLPDGQMSKGWEPSKKAMLFRKSGGGALDRKVLSTFLGFKGKVALRQGSSLIASVSPIIITVQMFHTPSIRYAYQDKPARSGNLPQNKPVKGIVSWILF